MANIFDTYGVKEVADVWFTALAADGDIAVGDPVLYLNTLKVSTIETTADSTDATGGRGNAKLISWDFGKEITVTLEDALLTSESLRIMMGGALKIATATTTVTVDETDEKVQTSTTLAVPSGLTVPTNTDATSGTIGYRWINMTNGTRGKYVFTVPSGETTGTWHGAPTVAAGDRIRFFWTQNVTGTGTTDAIEITISPYTFPGTLSRKLVGSFAGSKKKQNQFSELLEAAS